ncbi:MAG TPA: hypothetical protein VJI46_05975 [Candidatus Nanoarchaeia archaeon]|nr:hypothetical protein [Candidatus Nanoarchaeia archaeon]
MRKITALIVLALFMLSIPAYAYKVEVGGNTGIQLEVNETASTDTEDNDDNETDDDNDELDEDVDDETDDVEENQLETYARSRIKEADRLICEKRLNEAFPDASRDRIKNACQKHEKYILRLAEAGIEPRTVATVAATGMSRCVGFLQQNKSIEDAKDVCQKILKKEIVCVDYLTEMGVTNPVQKCDAVMVEAAPARVIKAALKLERFTFEQRKIAKERLEAAEEAYEKAKERFEKAKDVYKEKKDKFLDARKKVKECEGVDTEECKKLNEEILQHAKEFLTNAADKAIEHLNKILEKVKSAEGVSEEDANAIIADLENAISQLEDAKAKVAAAATKEEIEEAAKTIRDIWKKAQHRAVLNAARVVHSRLGEIIQRSVHLEEKLQCSISSVPEGADTTKLDSMTAEFSAHIATAKEKYDQAKELFQSARESEDKSSEGQAKALLKDAHDELKKAHSLLKDIVAEIKALGGKITSCPEEEVEEEAEDSEEEAEETEEESEPENETAEVSE